MGECNCGMFVRPISECLACSARAERIRKASPRRTFEQRSAAKAARDVASGPEVRAKADIVHRHYPKHFRRRHKGGCPLVQGASL